MCSEELPSLPFGAVEGQAGLLLPSLLREELLRPGLLCGPGPLRSGLCSPGPLRSGSLCSGLLCSPQVL
jgi:hypothetical protein